MVGRTSKERTGYPTQKPIALYERIIKASSNEGDVVLDPFCGCATTPIAAEISGRQWIGMDIWHGAYEMVTKRLDEIGFDTDLSGHLPSGKPIHYVDTPPQRTDDGRTAAESLPRVLRSKVPRQRYKMSNLTRDEKIDLVAKRTRGILECDGCRFRPPHNDRRYLEVDHIVPLSKKGKDIASNWTLLCGPCNKEKRDKLTIVELRDRNVANGWIVGKS